MSEVQVTEAEIAAHWREEETFFPPPRFIGQANATDPAIFDHGTQHGLTQAARQSSLAGVRFKSWVSCDARGQLDWPLSRYGDV